MANWQQQEVHVLARQEIAETFQFFSEKGITTKNIPLHLTSNETQRDDKKKNSNLG